MLCRLPRALAVASTDPRRARSFAVCGAAQSTIHAGPAMAVDERAAYEQQRVQDALRGSRLPPRQQPPAGRGPPRGGAQGGAPARGAGGIRRGVQPGQRAGTPPRGNGGGRSAPTAGGGQAPPALPKLPTREAVKRASSSSSARAASEAAFRRADTDGSGGLDQREVQQRLQDFGLDGVSQEYITGIFSAFDMNGDGVIDAQEFEKLHDMVIKRHEDQWERLERGDTGVLIKPDGPATKVVHEDDRSLAFYEKTGLLVIVAFLAFVGGGFFLKSVDEVQEMAKQCKPDICQNEARCVDILLGSEEAGTAMYEFNCVCRAGYSGLMCEDDIDECLSEPCQNGGDCAEDVDEYSCSCNDGFLGVRCQTDIDECRSHPCINRGLCDHQTEFVPGYSETALPPPGEYSCACQDGYTGMNCAEVLPTLRFFSLRAPCVATNCAQPRTEESATEVLGAAFGVLDENLVDLVVTQISEGDQVNFTLSTFSDDLNGMTVANFLPAGWLVLEAEIQQCDEALDAGSLFSSSCVAIDDADTVDVAACAAVTDLDNREGSTACDAVMSNADSNVQACEYTSDRATNIVECIEQYGQLMVDSNLDLYILEDLSGSFNDDLDSLAALSRKFVSTLELMFSTYRVGIGSFVDVGGYCFRSDHEIDDITAEELQQRMGDLHTSGQGFGCGVSPYEGEAVTTGLYQVGNQHEQLGFTNTNRCVAYDAADTVACDAVADLTVDTECVAVVRSSGTGRACRYEEAMRVVLMSTDDYFKLGPDGDDPTADGFDTTCEDTNSGGTLTYCSRIHSVAEVNTALQSSTPPIKPIFAVAGTDLSQYIGLMSQEHIDILQTRNDDMLNAYKDIMAALGGDREKFVTELSADSSDFVEIAVIALRQLVGDLPDECLPADECAEANACGDPECVETADTSVQADLDACGAVTALDDATACEAVELAADSTQRACTYRSPTCYDTPYGPKQCSDCPPGRAADPTNAGECSLDIDECCSSPCQHDSACTDGLDAYSCECTAGWEGDNCASDTDECLTAGCANDAVCLSSNITDVANLIAPGEFECICIAGYSGTLCDVDVNECASGPCENRGACTESTTDADVAVDAWTCSCVAGFEGEDCSTDINECASSPCQNGGVCDQPAPDMFGCECTTSDEFFAAHYEGEFCETELPIDYTYLILAIVSGIVLIVSCCLGCLYKYHKDNLVIFTVETLDKEGGAQGGQIVVQMRMKTWNTIFDVVSELERRENIQKREARLFFTPPGQRSGDDGMLDPSPDGPTLADCGIVTGSVVKLLQVWTIKVKEYSTQNIYELPVVERYATR